MKNYFTLWVDTVWKDDDSPVTKADIEINEMVINRIKEKFPDHSILWEESSFMKDDSEFTWVCDPIDWTYPFSFWMPMTTFSLALVDKDGVPVFWIVHDPFMERTYFAEKGKWAFINWNKIHVSSQPSIEKKVVGIWHWLALQWLNIDSFWVLKDFSDIWTRFTKFLSIAYQTVYVATWQIPGSIFFWKKPWDIAAIKIIVEEAWWKVTNLMWEDQRYDQECNWMIASNWLVHDELVAIVAKNLIK